MKKIAIAITAVLGLAIQLQAQVTTGFLGVAVMRHRRR